MAATSLGEWYNTAPINVWHEGVGVRATTASRPAVSDPLAGVCTHEAAVHGGGTSPRCRDPVICSAWREHAARSHLQQAGAQMNQHNPLVDTTLRVPNRLVIAHEVEDCALFIADRAFGMNIVLPAAELGHASAAGYLCKSLSMSQTFADPQAVWYVCA